MTRAAPDARDNTADFSNQQLAMAYINEPVNARLWKGASDSGRRREGVDEIAQRSESDDEDTGNARTGIRD
jgi:hypothetical protein